jgi:release factor glutamine methyltransferase
MSTKDWLAESTRNLENVSIGTARLDALIILEDQLGKDRAWLLAHPEFELTADDENVLNELIEQRATHVPLAYLRGKTEFYGREFIVSQAVLEPRPESETMIDLLLSLVATAPEFGGSDHVTPSLHAADPKPTGVAAQNVQKRLIRVADVGTGSGALGITASLEVPNIDVDLLEIDDQAIKIAKANVVAHATGNLVIKSDLMTNSTQSYDILLCNLPYVPDDYQINRAATYEPKIALFGGPDGLDLYKRLFDQTRKIPHQPLYILIEILPFQKEALLPIAEAASYSLMQSDDFIHVFKHIK